MSGRSKITVDLSNVLEKRVKIRATGANGKSFEVTVPREVVLREARRLGIPPTEAARKLRAVWRYNDFQGLHMELIYDEKSAEGKT